MKNPRFLSIRKAKAKAMAADAPLQARGPDGRFLEVGYVKPAIVVRLTRQQRRYQARMASKEGAA